MSLEKIIPGGFEQQAACEILGYESPDDPMAMDEVATLLLRFEDLFEETREAFALHEFSEESGQTLYVYRAVFDYGHTDGDYQVQVRRITVGSEEGKTNMLFGYGIEIFSPIETIDEHHIRYTSQHLDFWSDRTSVGTSISSRTIIEKDGVPIPDVDEAKYWEAVANYHDSHEHPDNPVDAEEFHKQLAKDLFRIARDVATERDDLEEIAGVRDTTPPHITPAMQLKLLTLASFIEGFSSYHMPAAG